MDGGRRLEEGDGMVRFRVGRGLVDFFGGNGWW